MILQLITAQDVITLMRTCRSLFFTVVELWHGWRDVALVDFVHVMLPSAVFVRQPIDDQGRNANFSHWVSASTVRAELQLNLTM